MNLQCWLNETSKKLELADVQTARLDTLILLEDITGKERGWLLAHPDFALQRSDLRKLNAWIQRRALHEPLAYIRGKSEFYGREFYVTADTLQPRPETETMITLLKNLLEHKSLVSKVEPWKVVDVGTGSGCLAVTAKLELTDLEVYATDINVAALKIARKNAHKLHADVTLLKGNLLEPFSKLQDPSSKIAQIILANLPYVPNDHTINQSAMHEPSIAIFGGKDGLDLYREMFEQVKEYGGRKALGEGGRPEYIFTESLPFQHEELAKIAEVHGYKQTAQEDFIQVFKLVHGLS